uniref:Uncharacterized protein n=1 Tax=viral metagenome TaxID=1070528 RepID=A0A6C0M0P8_9ZZZZ
MSYATIGHDDFLYNRYRERTGEAERIVVRHVTPQVPERAYAESPNTQTVYGSDGAYSIPYYRTQSDPPMCMQGWALTYDNLCVPVEQPLKGLYATDDRKRLLDVASSARSVMEIGNRKVYI